MPVAEASPNLPSPSGMLRAGMASVDITPPPGLPSLGYSIAAKHSTFNGYRTRLLAHALVVEDARGHKLVLATMDLAWGSALLNWKIAERLGFARGITLDRLLLSGTHTHTGPGGYSSVGMYNNQVPLGGAGYDPALVDFLVDRLVGMIELADERLTPARLSFGRIEATGLTRNRSPEAQAAFDTALSDDGRVDPVLTMIRVDGNDGDEIGAYMVYSGHPTVTGPIHDLWHSDVFGVAAHELRRMVLEEHPSQGDFVAALANGAEGDVSFRWCEQDHDTAVRLGRELARRAKDLHEALGHQLESSVLLTIDHRFEVIDLPGAALSDGRKLADRAVVGLSAAGGAEDGRTWLHPWLAHEGIRTHCRGDDQGSKRVLLGSLQRFVMDQDKAPREVPIQLVRVGPLHIVSLPFEMTVDAAREVRSQVRRVATDSGTPIAEEDVVVVSLANDYSSYCVTAYEYDSQQYEGGFTLYGPNTADLLAERAGTLARLMYTGRPQKRILPRLFQLGTVSCAGYRFPIARNGGFTLVQKMRSVQVGAREATVLWTGLDRAHVRIDAGFLIKIQVRAKSDEAWEELRTRRGVEDDLHLGFEVRLLHERGEVATWGATWHYPIDIDPLKEYRFALAARPGVDPEYSEGFRVPEVNADSLSSKDDQQ